jgi:uncharacterized protein YdaU (DUF1376 family)
MASPKYMRFFPEAYLNDTVSLNMEEQGVYMRLLCLMWINGGKIRSDDKLIAKMLGIHVNKWMKVKPTMMGYLVEHSPGYYTQNRLSEEYRYSKGKSKVSRIDTASDTLQDTKGVTTHNTPLDVLNNSLNYKDAPSQNPARFIDEAIEGLTKKFSGSLDQSKSISNINNNIRLDLEAQQSCGKLSKQQIDSFLNSLIRVFNAFNMTPPSDYEVIGSWINKGIDPEKYIIPTIRTILKRVEAGSIDPPKSWKYFAKEVYQSVNGSK